MSLRNDHFDGLVQDCSNSIADALELLQSFTKPSISSLVPGTCGKIFKIVIFKLIL